MKQTLIELFSTYAHEIIFLHILSAFIWVGGMIVIRLAVHPNLQLIDDPKIKLDRTLAITRSLFHLVIPFILILIFTAIVMAVGLGFREAAVDNNHQVINESAMYLYNLVHVKEGIWMLMSMNFIWMYIKRHKAQKLFDMGDLAGAKDAVTLLPKVLLPINIFLGILALWLGITLRGF